MWAQVILDTQTATTGAGKWKSFGNQKGNPAHRIWLGTSESGTDFEVTKVHSTGGVPFAGASLDGHMNAIFDERCVLTLPPVLCPLPSAICALCLSCWNPTAHWVSCCWSR